MQNDVTYLAIILGLFALMFLLVTACDRIIGKDEEAFEEKTDEAPRPALDDTTEIAA